MAAAKRLPWNQMDHDHEVLREEIVLANRVELRGPVPEFLAKKRAEQARGTTLAYEVAFGVFLRFCDERGVRTVGQIAEPLAHAFIDAERARGMAEGTNHDRVRRLKTWTRWMRKRGWTERDRFEDVGTPRHDPPEFDLIDADLRRAAFDSSAAISGRRRARSGRERLRQAAEALLASTGATHQADYSGLVATRQ